MQTDVKQECTLMTQTEAVKVKGIDIQTEKVQGVIVETQTMKAMVETGQTQTDKQVSYKISTQTEPQTKTNFAIQTDQARLNFIGVQTDTEPLPPKPQHRSLGTHTLIQIDADDLIKSRFKTKQSFSLGDDYLANSMVDLDEMRRKQRDEVI